MWNIYICEKKKSPCRVLNWFWLICHILSHKNINYAILYYSNLQLTAYNAYISLQITTNLMVKHIARSHFLGHCGQEVLLRQTAISPRQPPRFRNTNLKTKFSRNKSSIFSYTWKRYLYMSRNLIQTCPKLIFKWKISKNGGNGFPITLCDSQLLLGFHYRFLTLLTMNSFSKSKAQTKKQGMESF